MVWRERASLTLLLKVWSPDQRHLHHRSGNLSEMHILRFPHRPTEPEIVGVGSSHLYFNKCLQVILMWMKLEDHRSRTLFLNHMFSRFMERCRSHVLWSLGLMVQCTSHIYAGQALITADWLAVYMSRATIQVDGQDSANPGLESMRGSPHIYLTDQDFQEQVWA